MKTFKEYLSEGGYAATARAGEREWASQVDREKTPSKARMPAPDLSHNEKMFKFHAKMAAVARTKGDEKSKLYHNTKLKQYSS